MEQTPVEHDEIESFRHLFREWLASTDVPCFGADLHESFARQKAWQGTLAKAGWLGVDWPAEFGGRGLTPLHQMAVMEELTKTEAPMPVSIVNLYVIGPTILAWGTREQKQKHLARMLAADEVWCQGFSEPGAGSDLASLRTSATIDGDSFVVNGQKVWTSQAQYADFCALLARTDTTVPNHQGISYLLVNMKSPGITVRPIRQISGGAEFNEVFFDNVRVPVTDILGRVNEGWQVAVRTLASERSSIMVQRKAEAEAVVAKAIRALRKLAGSGQVVPDRIAFRVGHVRMQLAALDAVVRDLVERLRTGRPMDGQDSLAKLILTEVEQEAFSLSFDLLGPYRQVSQVRPLGLDADHLIHDYFYSRSRSISGGTTQVQRNVVAQRVLGMPRQ